MLVPKLASLVALAPSISRSTTTRLQSTMSGITIILSPAKTLDLTMDYSDETTRPSCNPAKTREIAQIIKNLSKSEMKKVFGVSDAVAEKTKAYWDDFVLDDASSSNGRPCIYTYTGMAYQGLDVETCTKEMIDYMQKSLRILDGVYGALRPLDEIQAYRMEMLTKVPGIGEKLSTYWKTDVTEQLVREMKEQGHQLLVNAASDEYSATVDWKGLPDGIIPIKVKFTEDGRVVTVHAKKARGLIVRFLAAANASTVDDIRKFNLEGYVLDESASDETLLVFNRKKQTAKRGSTASQRSTKRSKK